MIERAGAMMVDTMIRLKAVADKAAVTAHFLNAGQSLGFSQSKGVVNVTRKVSSSGVCVATSLGSFSLSAL